MTISQETDGVAAQSDSAVCTPSYINQQLQTILNLGPNLGPSLERSDGSQLTNDQTAEIQRSLNTAFGALQQCGEKAVSALKTLLAADHANSIRASAMVALGSLGSQADTAVPDLVESLRSHDDTIRPYILKALSGIGAGAVSELIKVLQNSQESSYTYVLVYALGHVDVDTEKVPIVEQLTLLKNQPEQDIDSRWMAAVGLDRHGQDMNAFFAEHQMLVPKEEDLKCVEAHLTGDESSDLGQTQDIYIFDVYTKQCKKVGSMPLPPNARTDPATLLEKIKETLNRAKGKSSNGEGNRR